MNGLLSGTACTTTIATLKFGFAQRATTTAAAQSHTSLLLATTAVMRGKEEVDVHDGRAERILNQVVIFGFGFGCICQIKNEATYF
jgi:hypothetical protein